MKELIDRLMGAWNSFISTNNRQSQSVHCFRNAKEVF